MDTLNNGCEVTLSVFGEDFTLEEQNAAARIFSLAREHQYSSEDAVDAAGTMLKIKNKKSDAEIGSLSGTELTEYIERMRLEKQGK